MLNSFSNSWVLVGVLLSTLSCARGRDEVGGQQGAGQCSEHLDCQTGESCVEGACVDPDRQEAGSDPDAPTEPTSKRPGMKPPRPTPNRNGFEDAGPNIVPAEPPPDSAMPPEPSAKPDCTDSSDCPDVVVPPEPPTRLDCNESPDCPDGSLCHLDGRCLAWGDKDSQGAELLATTDFARGARIRDIWVSDDGVYYLDSGTDALYDPNFDGAVRLLRHGERTPSLIHGGFSRALQMVAEGDSLFVLDVPRSVVEITLGKQPEARTLDLGCGAKCGLVDLAVAPGGLYYIRADQSPSVKYSLMC